MNTSNLIAYSILGFGLFVFLILVLRSLWLQRKVHIKHYEENRNELTSRKKKEVNKNVSFKLPISSLISGFITILIGVSLIGPISDQVNAVSNQLDNVSTSYSSAVLSIVPAFFAVAIIILAISIIYSSLREYSII